LVRSGGSRFDHDGRFWGEADMHGRLASTFSVDDPERKPGMLRGGVARMVIFLHNGASAAKFGPKSLGRRSAVQVAQIEQHLFRGAPPLNEVVFFHPATRTLILTDLAFNIPKEAAKRSPLFYWLWDVGHFGPHRFVRLRGIRDQQAARGSVEKILSWKFDRIIVSHGEVLETDGHNHFAKAFAFLRGTRP